MRITKSSDTTFVNNLAFPLAIEAHARMDETIASSMTNPYSTAYEKATETQSQERETQQTHKYDFRGSKRKLPQQEAGADACHNGSQFKNPAGDTTDQGDTAPWVNYGGK